jgi:glycosyltransferase involved in cell wall biosynthesis
MARIAPRIAIATACYNHAHFLGEALESIEASTVEDWELVVVDDGSTDDSLGVALSYAEQNPRIRVLTFPENRGLAAAHNAAVRATSAPWLVKVDADDRIAPTYLEAILAAAAEDPTRNVIFSGARVFGNELYDYVYPPFDPARMIDTLMIPGPAAYRRPLWEAVDGQDESLRGCEDWDFWVRAELAVGLRPYQLPGFLWEYRSHDGPRVSRDATPRLDEYKAHMRTHRAKAGR